MSPEKHRRMITGLSSSTHLPSLELPFADDRLGRNRHVEGTR